MKRDSNVSGINIAKRVFHVIGMATQGTIIVRKRFYRGEVLDGPDAAGHCRNESLRWGTLLDSNPPQGQLQQGREPDAPLPLCPSPAGGSHHLAGPAYHMPSGVYHPLPLRLTLSLEAAGRGPRCFVGDAWWPGFGAVRGHVIMQGYRWGAEVTAQQ